MVNEMLFMTTIHRKDDAIATFLIERDAEVLLDKTKTTFEHIDGAAYYKFYECIERRHVEPKTK